MTEARRLTAAQKTGSIQLRITLDHKSYVPVSRQISDAVRRHILEGRLAPGQAMPSVRELSAELGISRSTVLKSFEDLFSQGYITTTHGCGTFVSRQLPGNLDQEICRKAPGGGESRQSPVPVPLSAYGQRLLSQEEHRGVTGIYQLAHGGPPLDLTPLPQWRLLLERHCRLKDLSRFDFKEEPFGYEPLREAYASYLTRARAVACSAGQVAVFFARDLRLDLLCRLLIEPGDFCAVENPGYPSPRQKFAAHGAKVVPVPVDDQGLNVDYLTALPQHFKFVYVTPSHQEPTGAVLPLARRKQLLAWARKTGTFIIEDDYDSEYRYGSSPLPSLQGLDDGDCVIHLSCLWKILSPVLRLGFLVLPHCLVFPVYLAKTLAERDLPLIDQFALTDFINEGHLERCIRRMRAIYARRRQTLVGALESSLKGRITIAAESAGTEILVSIRSHLSDENIIEQAGKSGLTLISSRPYYLGPGKQGEFILPFAGLDEASAESGARKLSALLSGK